MTLSNRIISHLKKCNYPLSSLFILTFFGSFAGLRDKKELVIKTSTISLREGFIQP